MQKLLLLFLLFVAPLQATWAGVDAYLSEHAPFVLVCHDDMQETHVDTTSSDDKSTVNTTSANHGVHSCHICCMPLIVASHINTLLPASNLVHQLVEPRYPLAMINDRPERPQWSDVAA